MISLQKQARYTSIWVVLISGTLYAQQTTEINPVTLEYKYMKLTPKSFYFIRHGQTDWNKIHRLQGQIDIPLNEEGRSQARQLQQLLHNLDICHVYYSPLSRAQETMHIACAHLDIPKFEVDALKERHFGEWQGTEWDEVKKDTHMHVVPQNGESYAAFHERVLTTINGVLEASEGTVLFVAHAGTFRALCRVIDTHFEAAVHNCQLFHFVAPDATCDQWMIYQI
ncbi:MAG: histidine phosphatase family protein [Candidatus Babeliales bacterium]